jgi:hypothetical protein
MPFKADTYRVLVVSPPDLKEKRHATAEVINQQNALHATAESLILLPVECDTVVVPSSGKWPTEAINTQLMIESDMLVGVFGAASDGRTGEAEAKTVDQIEEYVAAGKPVLLYFLSYPLGPQPDDLQQRRNMKAFNVSTQKTVVARTFSDWDVLRHTLFEDLMNQVRSLYPWRSRGIPAIKFEQTNKTKGLTLTDRGRQFRLLQWGSPDDGPSVPAKPPQLPTVASPPEETEGPNGCRIGYSIRVKSGPASFDVGTKRSLRLLMSSAIRCGGTGIRIGCMRWNAVKRP